jgi:uncharacterized membrane protein
MIFLLLAVLSSLFIGMILKHAGVNGIDRLGLLTVNYAVATLVALSGLLLLDERISETMALSGGVVALGILTGVLFIAGFFLFALATSVSGMGLSIGVMRVSVVIPFLASWWIWNETPTTMQGFGLAVASVAFFLIARKDLPEAGIAPYPSVQTEKPVRVVDLRALAVLAALFVAGGFVDTALKTFHEVYAAAYSLRAFLLIVFLVAFLLGTGFMAARKQKVSLNSAILRWGAVLGIVNYASGEFILHAVARLSGPFVFPANNIAIVLGGAVIGVVVWGEHLSRTNMAGLLLAAVALLMLSL